MLDALASQTYAGLEIVAVDNGSTDGCRAILIDRLPAERVLIAERDLGFPAAVSMALDSAAAAAADPAWLLLVHDDLVLGPDAVERLVEHVVADPRLAIVGPKLLDHDAPQILQQVGWSMDLTGRAESGLEEDELDQGQRDRPRPVLYVTTAGMLVRRDAFDTLGRFDRRFHVLRDDLDLCWRAWIAGYEVEVAPQAVGRHVRAVATYQRDGGALDRGARYYAERNTLAALLKNYSALRLLVVLPLFGIVGTAKVGGFLATRRIGDAWQTLRAWGWNVVHLHGTLRLRTRVQENRVRTDGDLSSLFTRIAPRLRAYAEAIADRVAGGDLDVPPPPEEGAEVVGFRRFASLHPVFITAIVLAVLGVASAFPLLGSGAFRGGDFAPWPASSLDFLRAYVSGWNDPGGLGSADPASPAQALLGLWGIVMFGSEWLAPRLLLFGALPVAWLLSLRAGRIVTPHLLPRVAGATAYVVSPPALAALTTGRLGGLAVFVALPVLALASGELADPRTPGPRAWRAAAVAALAGAALVAFEPPAAWLVLLVAAVGLIAVAGLPASGRERQAASLRIVGTVIGVVVLLVPWSLELAGADTPLIGGFGDPAATAAPFWRWLLLVPDTIGYPGLVVGAAYPAAGALGLLLGFPRRPILVGTLWSVVLLCALAAWGLGRAGDTAIAWPGLVLLVAAFAYAGLLAAAFASAGEVLAEHAFGWRQVLSLVTSAAVAVGALGAALYLLRDPWAAFVVGEPSLPAFIVTEQEVPGPFRVLVLSDRGDDVAWDVTGPDGPTMVRYGAPESSALVGLVGRAIEDVVGHVHPAAGARLGLANILYVYVPEGGRSDRLQSALDDQFDLEPQPVENGLVYRVHRWAPRAAWLSSAQATVAARRGELPPNADPVPLVATGDDTYRGEVPGAGTILLAEPAHPGWTAEVDGTELRSSVDNRLLRFRVDADGDATVRYGATAARQASVAIQIVLVLLAFSIVLRPPGTARERI